LLGSPNLSAVGTLAGIRGWWTPLVSGTPKQDGELVLRFRALEETIRFQVECFQLRRSVRPLPKGAANTW
jgi:hypothetical protein